MKQKQKGDTQKTCNDSGIVTMPMIREEKQNIKQRVENYEKMSV